MQKSIKPSLRAQKTEQKRDQGSEGDQQASESSSEDVSVPFLAGLVQKGHGFNEYLPTRQGVLAPCPVPTRQGAKTPCLLPNETILPCPSQKRLTHIWQYGFFPFLP